MVNAELEYRKTLQRTCMQYGGLSENEMYGAVAVSPRLLAPQMPVPQQPQPVEPVYVEQPSDRMWGRAFRIGSVLTGAGAVWTGAAGLHALRTKRDPRASLITSGVLGLGATAMHNSARRKRRRATAETVFSAGRHALFNSDASTDRAQVKTHLRNGRVVRAHTRKVDDEDEQQGSQLRGPLKAAAVFAGLLGISVAAYMGIKTNYNARTNAAVARLRKLMQEDKLPEVPGLIRFADNKPIVFTADGIHNTRHNGYFGTEIHETFDVNVVKLPLTRTERPDSEVITATSSMIYGAKVYTRDLLKNKPSDDAMLLVHGVLQQRKLNPDSRIILAGHSGGGIAVNEAQDILNRLGVQTKAVNTSSQYYGIESVNRLNNATIVGKDDPPLTTWSRPHNIMFVEGDHFPQHHEDTQIEWKRAMQILGGIQPRTTEYQNITRYRFVPNTADQYVKYEVKK